MNLLAVKTTTCYVKLKEVTEVIIEYDIFFHWKLVPGIINKKIPEEKLLWNQIGRNYIQS